MASGEFIDKSYFVCLKNMFSICCAQKHLKNNSAVQTHG